MNFSFDKDERNTIVILLRGARQARQDRKIRNLDLVLTGNILLGMANMYPKSQGLVTSMVPPNCAHRRSAINQKSVRTELSLLGGKIFHPTLRICRAVVMIPSARASFFLKTSGTIPKANYKSGTQKGKGIFMKQLITLTF